MDITVLCSAELDGGCEEGGQDTRKDRGKGYSELGGGVGRIKLVDRQDLYFEGSCLSHETGVLEVWESRTHPNDKP